MDCTEALICSATLVHPWNTLIFHANPLGAVNIAGPSSHRQVLSTCHLIFVHRVIRQLMPSLLLQHFSMRSSQHRTDISYEKRPFLWWLDFAEWSKRGRHEKGRSQRWKHLRWWLAFPMHDIQTPLPCFDRIRLPRRIKQRSLAAYHSPKRTKNAAFICNHDLYMITYNPSYFWVQCVCVFNYKCNSSVSDTIL